MESNIEVYSLSKSSPRYFGDIMIIIAAWKDHRGVYKGEWFVLCEKSEKRLTQDKYSFPLQAQTNDLFTIDLEFVQKTGFDLAETAVSELLGELFKQSDNMSLFSVPIRFDKVDKNELTRRWLRGHWQNEIREIRDMTNLEELGNYLLAISGLASVKIGK